MKPRITTQTYKYGKYTYESFSIGLEKGKFDKDFPATKEFFLTHKPVEVCMMLERMFTSQSLMPVQRVQPLNNDVAVQSNNTDADDFLEKL